MSFKKSLYIFSTLGILLTAYSCIEAPPLVSKNEAHQKLIQLLKKEYQYPAVVTPLDNTVWIYVPLDGNLLEIKAAAGESPSSTRPIKGYGIQYLNAEYNARLFVIEYAIDSIKKYTKNQTYGLNYSEEFSRKFQNIRSSIWRAYGEMDQIPGDVEYLNSQKQESHENLVKDHIKTEKPPDFFVIVMADIKIGIEVKTYFYFPDLKRAMVDASFMEEFIKRNVSEEPLGNTAIIDDKDGSHLNYKEILMPEFLAKQISNRINFKYQHSSFPPSDNIKEEMLAIIKETVDFYNFDNFESAQLEDLIRDEIFTVGRENLGQYKTEN